MTTTLAGSRRPAARLSSRLFLGVALWTSVPGCGDDSPADAPAATAAVTTVSVPPALVDASWPVQMADDANRAAFEGHAGWSALFQRDLVGSMAGFAADGNTGRGLARTHAELSSVYRQAALLAANATRHVYGSDRQADVDPPEVDYLLGISLALLGECEESSAALSKLGAESVPAAGVDYWKTRSQGSPCGSLELGAPPEAFPAPAGTPQAGVRPTPPELPHLRFTELGDGGRDFDVTNPAALLALAAWHEAAAKSAAPDGEGAVIDALLAPWRLPGEAAPAVTPGEVHAEWLFAGFALSGGDVPFLVAAPRDGVGAVSAHAATSPLASALLPAVDGDKIDPEKVLDVAAGVRQVMETAMEAKGGSVQAFHRPFAEVARVAVLRAGMLVADGAGQYRDAGILRINALERSNGPTGDPVFLMSVAAWDAGNRNPLRAQEVIHALVRTYPALEAARTPLDALHIRLSRSSTSGGPVF